MERQRESTREERVTSLGIPLSAASIQFTLSIAAFIYENLAFITTPFDSCTGMEATKEQGMKISALPETVD